VSVVADGNQKHICPFDEYVCCYMRDYSEYLRGNSAIDGHDDDIKRNPRKCSLPGRLM